MSPLPIKSGRKEDALVYAIRFMNGSKELQFGLGGVWTKCGLVIQAFLDAGRDDLFVEMLELIEVPLSQSLSLSLSPPPPKG